MTIMMMMIIIIITISAQQHMLQRAICYRPSVCPSDRHTGGSVKNGWS